MAERPSSSSYSFLFFHSFTFTSPAEGLGPTRTHTSEVLNVLIALDWVKWESMSESGGLSCLHIGKKKWAELRQNRSCGFDP